ncbi:MAG: pyridoxal-dependent decarboxylase, exosortase A system-associated [Burkholderiaceae bacterium]|nr:pyridoxal-dependent decarboxylase, exosortase A system-associated [Burkholderiaceae bacterium]
MSDIPVHSKPLVESTATGELLIGGQRLTRLVERAGRTPFYAYDRRLIRSRVAELRETLPAGTKLHYAMKANPFVPLVCFMSQLVDGIDVASAGELNVALNAGADPAEVSFAGPGKSEAELSQAVASGVLINVESQRELRLLASVADRLGIAPRVALRVNPGFELKGSGMKMGGGPKQFGIDEEDIPEALADIRALGLAFEGFHLFAGSQNLRADAVCEAQRQAFALARRLAVHAPAPVRVLNLGGGFGIPYFPGERPLALGPIGENLTQIREQCLREMPEAIMVVELGRYLVGEAGVYVARVVDRKVSRDQIFLITDGGLNHHLSASGNFGQVIRKNFPVAINGKASGQRETVSVVGPLCTPLDLLADRVELPAADIGDLFVVFQSGAYGASASPQAFLGHPPCAELLV